MLLDDQHRSAGLRGEFAYEWKQALDDDGSEAKTHLVDHEQPRFADKGTAQGEHLLLAT